MRQVTFVCMCLRHVSVWRLEGAECVSFHNKMACEVLKVIPVWVNVLTSV